MGKSVAVIKHTSHDHSFDTDGKDTYNFKLNGASATLIYSPLKYMIVKDYKKIGNEEENIMSFIQERNGANRRITTFVSTVQTMVSKKRSM